MDVGQLADLEAIKQLKARYFRAVDTKDWDLFRGVFADDVRVWYPSSTEWIEGADAVVAHVSKAFVPEAISVHQGYMPEIEHTGPDTAKGIWPMRDDVQMPRPGGRVWRLLGAGHYHEEYRRIGTQWKISSLVLTRLRVDESISP
jgi:SnoaL-like protein